MKKAPIPLNEEQRLGALNNLRVLDTKSEAQFDRITKLAAMICESDISLISLIDSDRQWFKSKYGLDADETPRDISYCGHAINQDDIFIIEDANAHEDFKDNPLCVGAPHVVFYAGVPLKTSNGFNIGTLCTIHSKAKTLNNDQIDALKDLADQVVKLLELRLVSKQFNEISNAAKIGHWSFDLSSQNIEWSPKMFELFNFDPINGNPNFEQYKSLIHPDDFENVQNSIFKSIKKKKAYKINHRVFNTNGEEVWLEGYGEPVFDKNGEVIAINGVCQDINDKMLKSLELKEYQKELKESNHYLSFVMEGAGLGIWDWNIEDNSVNFDENWAKMFGYDLSEISNHPSEWESRIHPEDIEKCYEDVQAHLRGETDCYENTHRIKHKNGSWLYILGRGRISERNEKGEPIRFTGTNLDMSSEKEKELELIQKSSEQKVLNNLLSIDKIHNLDLISKLEKSFNLILNVPWLQFYKKGGLFLTENNELKLKVSVELGEKIESMCSTVKCGQCLCGRAMESKKVIHASCVDHRHENTFEGISEHGHYNVPILGREGDVLGVTVFYLPHGHKKNQEEVNFLKSCSEVLAQIILSHQYERDLIAQRDLALSSEKSKAEFLANMSHEIRTPMNGIIGLLDLFPTQELTESQNDLIGTIKNSSDHLLNILNDILDFSKIDSGNLSIEKVPYNIKETVLDIVKLNNTNALRKGIDLNLNLKTHQENIVLGDPVRFRQIIDNFVSNAIKFTEVGAVDIVFDIIDTKGSHLTFRIDIKDSGIGLSELESERLFQAFSQADNSITRKYGGTGLGLSISKRLAEMMGGKVEFSSVKGIGSTFSLIIELEKTVTSDTRDILDAEIQFNHDLKILIVEDNEINQKLLSMMLKRLGLESDIKSNGLECVSFLKETSAKYDIIFMDMQMPEMDGLNCTKVIRDEHLAGSPYIIAQTANAYNEDKEICFEAGMDGFLAKPIKKNDLVRVLNIYKSTLKKTA